MNGGGTPSWDDLVEISTYLRGKRVKLHMDGARLFEVLPYYGKPLEELAALFDTVYVSFYKGIGALASAMVLGPRDVLDAVRAQVSKRGGKLFRDHCVQCTRGHWSRSPKRVSCGQWPR